MVGMGAAGSLAARALAAAGPRVVGLEAEAEIGGAKRRSALQSYRLSSWDLGRWPLGPAELEPYYARVEELFGVGPGPASAWTEAMAAAAARLGWDPFAAPVAGRGPLAPEDLGEPIADGRLRILTGTEAVRVETGSGGAATGVEAVSGSRRFHLRARRVLLAAYVFENVRLLLGSRSPTHPDGAGNSSGQVGRHFATHSFLFAHGRFPGRDLGRAGGGPGQATAVERFDGGRPDGRGRGFRGGSVLQAAMGVDPERIAAVTGIEGEEEREVGAVWAQPEQLTRERHRLERDGERTDRLGRPALSVHHGLAAEDERRAGFLLARMEEWLREAGAARTWRAPVRAESASTHSYGGTRMGTDAAGSVVDSFGAVHDTPGLFVAGASTFPTTGGRGPTLTVEALAWRTADRIAAELR